MLIIMVLKLLNKYNYCLRKFPLHETYTTIYKGHLNNINN